MAIDVRFSSCRHPWKPGDYVKLYNKARGQYTFDRLCDDISSYCSLTRADVAGCMEALLEFTLRWLLEGYSVLLRNIGSFFIKLESTMVTLEWYDAHPNVQPAGLIKDYRVHFLPCIKLRRYIRKGAQAKRIVQPFSTCPPMAPSCQASRPCHFHHSPHFWFRSSPSSILLKLASAGGCYAEPMRGMQSCLRQPCRRWSRTSSAATYFNAAPLRAAASLSAILLHPAKLGG